MTELKAHLSKWIKTKDESLKNFYWRDGNGAFSANPSRLMLQGSYIKNRHEHHQKKASRINIDFF
jgi:hypothetical protein